MSDMRDRLIADPQPSTGTGYAELAPEQTTRRPQWYDDRRTRIAMCIAVVLVVCGIMLVPLVISRGGEDIDHHMYQSSSSSSSSTGAAGDWSSSSSTGSVAPPYIGNVSFAGMSGRQFGSDSSPHVVITMPNVNTQHTYTVRC